MLRWMAFVLVTVSVSTGCMDLDTEVYVRKDGSAAVSQSVVFSPEFAGLMALGGDELVDEPSLRSRAEQMGDGVEYLGANEISRQDGSRGYVARYGVADIADLALTGNLVFAPAPGGNGRLGAWASDGVLWNFQFAPGNEPVLSIVHEWPEEGGDTGGANSGSDAPAGGNDALADWLMKSMFEDLRMRVHVRVDGSITESNARYMSPEESHITLLSMDFAQLMANGEGSAWLEELGRGSREETAARVARLGDESTYIRVDTQRVIRVKFGSRRAPAERYPIAGGESPQTCEGWNTGEFFNSAAVTDVTRCLALGKDVNAREYETSPTPLHRAAQVGSPAMIGALIEAGADVEATANFGEGGGPYSGQTGFTPLHVAGLWGTPANTQALIDAGANVHIDGLLGWVAARGRPDTLKLLIDAGVPVESALFDAVHGDPANIAVLLAAGADYRARDGRGNTPLHAASALEFWEGGNNAVASIVALSEAGADIEARNADGRTPLHLAAAWSGGPASVKALVDAGADTEVRNADGWTPLHLAASMSYDGLESGDLASLEALIDAGADVEARDYHGRTPLHVAVRHGHPYSVSALLEAGANALARDLEGLTPLLEPREYALWEGDWLSEASSPGDNVYENLSITNADAAGFTYSFECRDVPYGPNAVRTDEARAFFRGSLEAEDPANGQTFARRVDPDDRHARVIQTGEPSYGPPRSCALEGTGNFVFQRSIYRPGFDCDQAATSVEMAICRNELIALGDYEMSTVYRALMEEFTAESAARLRSSQRTWLNDRNRSCVSGDAVDDICLARLYSDRLAALAKLHVPSMGVEPRFDATYALALVTSGRDLRRDTPTRLAMYPRTLADATDGQWQADESGFLFEQTYVDTRVVWPATVDFRYSDMLFVGSTGTVWTAAHTEPLVSLDVFRGHQPRRVWMEAGRGPFAIRSEDGFESTDAPPATGDVPDLVRGWLSRHPISEIMRLR